MVSSSRGRLAFICRRSPSSSASHQPSENTENANSSRQITTGISMALAAARRIMCNKVLIYSSLSFLKYSTPAPPPGSPVMPPVWAAHPSSTRRLPSLMVVPPCGPVCPLD